MSEADVAAAPVVQTVELDGEQQTLLATFNDACDQYVRALRAAADGGVPPEIIQGKMMETLTSLGAPPTLLAQAVK